MASSRSVAKWQSLSDDYRNRLERKGYTLTRYLQGENLSAGRGHAKTPERPERALKNPGHYPEYIAKHAPELGPSEPTGTQFDLVWRHVRSMFIDALNAGTIDRVDLQLVKERISRLTPPQQAILLTYDIEKWQAAAQSQVRKGKRIGAAGGMWIKLEREWDNPFWYH